MVGATYESRPMYIRGKNTWRRRYSPSRAPQEQAINSILPNLAKIWWGRPPEAKVSLYAYNRLARIKGDGTKGCVAQLSAVIIYKAFFFDVAQGRMNGAPSEIKLTTCFASQAC